ncbi:MAG: L-histidine N(alpha)-methyltransferase [Rickettsiales bacterium]
METNTTPHNDNNLMHSYSSIIETTNNNIPPKTLFDYLSFFTKKTDTNMSSYIYLDSCNYYDKLIRNSKDYYLCNDHIELIKNSKDSFTKHLNDITDIIEIGPGSDYVIRNKTMVILDYARNAKNYLAIDNCKQYLDETCDFLKTNTSNINISSLEADLMQEDKLQVPLAENSKKCLLFLGGTLANFHKEQQNHCLKQIYNMLNPGDLFIITADTNQNEESLIRAYHNQDAQNLFMGVVNYFATINDSFRECASALKIECKWNKLEQYVDIFFVAQEKFSFKFSNNKDIIIEKAQELRGIRAYKQTQQENISILNKNGFKVIDILNNSNKTKEFICRRV